MLLNDLFERKLTPGERQGIELKIDKYKKALREIEKHQYAYNQMGDIVIPGTEKQLEELKAEYKKVIDKLQAALDQEKGKDGLSKFVAGIVKNCPTILKAMKTTDRMLYRGTRESMAAFYGRPYNERKSKDSSSDLSDAFNKALKDAGAVARRDNSVFCTTSRNLASMFGHTLYLVFPRDPMHYTWSDKEKDLVLNTEHMDKLVSPELVKDIMRQIWPNEKFRKEFIDVFKNELYLPDRKYEDFTFDVDKYPNGADVNYVSPFRQHNFYASVHAAQAVLPYLGEQYNKYLDFANWVDSNSVITNYGIHIDEGLNAAFRRGWEITIHADYYAIRSDYEKQVRALLGMSEYAGERDIGDEDPPKDEGY